ncbi:MAG: TetR family transcriptional regulator C-terminal domain-containing protein [Desulfovibrio sp.]|nr:TetR family transcriptional regulator C-terminal domain-containing protein [Desulfovibrio sp.]MBI4959824.1 TetR family transcriptional regulator C-terminal domain-containing protein [Desulfovibrio sp.]
MRKDSRNTILEAAAPLIHSQGFHKTGLKEILDAAGVPKGSFYFYFKSKEEFGLALVDYLAQSMRQLSAPILQDKTVPPLERLSRFFTMLSQSLKAAGFERGCPIGNLAQEMSDLSPGMREHLKNAMAAFCKGTTAVLQEAMESGELSGNLDPAEAASFIFDAWEGALLRMKAEKSSAPLERFHSFIFNRLLR